MNIYLFIINMSNLQLPLKLNDCLYNLEEQNLIDENILNLYEIVFNNLKIQLNLIKSINYDNNIPHNLNNIIKYDLLSLDIIIDNYNMRSSIKWNNFNMIKEIDNCSDNNFLLFPSNNSPYINLNEKTLEFNNVNDYVATNYMTKIYNDKLDIIIKLEDYYNFIDNLEINKIIYNDIIFYEIKNIEK